MFVIPAIAWMGLIFYFSSQNGSESSGLSMRVLTYILDFLGLQNANVELLGFLIRKAAHASVYFVLALLVILAIIKSTEIIGFKRYVFTLLTCFLYACTDEIHQGFVPGRVMSFTDVLIDTLGAAAALFVFFLGVKVYEKIKKRVVSA